VTNCTQPQYMVALARANKIRLARADRKRWLNAGGDLHEATRRALMVLSGIPWDMETCSVGKFLECIPRVGPIKVHDILKDVLISENRNLGDMTARQRQQLADELRRRI
jgi:hypothetical protein